MFDRKRIDVKVIFYYLFILDGKGKKNYDAISKDARDVIKECYHPDQQSIEDNVHDKYCTFSFNQKPRINKNGIFLNNIKHYKVRIIFTSEGILSGDNLSDIFAQIRSRLKEIEEEKVFKKYIDCLKLQPHISDVCQYPLVEILKDYSASDFKNLVKTDEAITTFCYEVPDYRKEKTAGQKVIQKLFSPMIGKVFVRLSRPSVIVTKMSDFMRMEVINIIYDTCLYDLRKNKRDKPDEITFKKMKDSLGQNLFNNEISTTNLEINRLLDILSYMMSLGAIASIVAVIMFIPYYDIAGSHMAVNKLRTFLGLILGFWAIVIFTISIIRRR
jgi:hypothetical protein